MCQDEQAIDNGSTYLHFISYRYIIRQRVRMSMIYSLIARQQVVLVDYSSFSGNFSQVALEVLGKTNLSKTFGQFATANYSFYTFVKEKYIFLAMVQSNYQMRIAVNFLKKIQDSFFSRYDPSRRGAATAHSLKDFKPILQEWMAKYNNKTEVDKLSSLKKELSELEEQALRNMDKVIERGERIQILVKKSETLADQSLDLRDTSKKVKNKMWWKNKKVMIGIIAIIIIIIVVIVIIVVV